MNLLQRVSGWCFGLLATALVLTSLAVAADWSRPVGDLAKAIATETGPGFITLAVSNSSSLTKDQVGEIQRMLEAQLRTAGVRVTTGASATSNVRVTLSESLNSYVWVAEIAQGNETHVEMATAPRENGTPITKAGTTVEIRKALLWTQSKPILDVLVLDPGTPTPRLVVLDADAIGSYVLASGKWKPEQAWNLTRTGTLPRDLRGLLVAGPNRSLDAYLPGTVCNVNNTSVSASVCRDSDDAWKIGQRSAFFNSGRNYFTGALVPASDKALGPFYSMAWLERQGYPLMVATGVDGRVHMNDDVNERTMSPTVTADWGSDLAAVKTGCGSGSQLLVTSAGDDTKTDSLRAYDMPDRDPVMVSAITEFPGPITALWSHDAAGAMAVVHNLRTEQYEAYSISVLCTQ